MSSRHVLAVDLGAESGRVMSVSFDGARLKVQEVHRFPNLPVKVRGTLYWNMLALWREIAEGIEAGQDMYPESIGVDAWGVDFGLLDRQGALVSMPVHHRDDRTNGVPERLFAHLPARDVFITTGIQDMRINTLFQLWSMVEAGSPHLKIASTLLTIPDLINFWLSGEKVCEYTIATTTQMLDARNRRWALDMLDRLGLPSGILPPVVDPGTRLGDYQGIPVIAPACHDTGSAVAAIPSAGTPAGYISSGTWSLAGTEIDKPVLSDEAFEANVTNEGGVAGTVRLLKNVMGLWILQQCRATWAHQGTQYSYEELVALAHKAPSLRSVVPVNDDAFLPPGDHPYLIRRLCRETKQSIPRTPGETVRAVIDSLALAYSVVFDMLERLSGQSIAAIHIIGGGSENDLLNQATADATGKVVLAGPTEAAVLGNALIQLMAIGDLGSVKEGRELIAASSDIRRFEPHDGDAWAEAKERYQRLQQFEAQSVT